MHRHMLIALCSILPAGSRPIQVWHVGSASRRQTRLPFLLRQPVLSAIGGILGCGGQARVLSRKFVCTSGWRCGGETVAEVVRLQANRRR